MKGIWWDGATCNHSNLPDILSMHLTHPVRKPSALSTSRPQKQIVRSASQMSAITRSTFMEYKLITDKWKRLNYIKRR
jgi:hypothetical protein